MLTDSSPLNSTLIKTSWSAWRYPWKFYFDFEKWCQNLFNLIVTPQALKKCQPIRSSRLASYSWQINIYKYTWAKSFIIKINILYHFNYFTFIYYTIDLIKKYLKKWKFINLKRLLDSYTSDKIILSQQLQHSMDFHASNFQSECNVDFNLHDIGRNICILD